MKTVTLLEGVDYFNHKMGHSNILFLWGRLSSLLKCPVEAQHAATRAANACPSTNSKLSWWKTWPCEIPEQSLALFNFLAVVADPHLFSNEKKQDAYAHEYRTHIISRRKSELHIPRWLIEIRRHAIQGH
jgi:hypothetical protein